MKQIYSIAAATLILIALVLAAAQAPSSTGQSPQRLAQPKGRLLVDRLPDGVDGVVLDKKTAALRLKSGYEFVKKDNRTVQVAVRMAGGGRGNIVFTGSCNCIPPKGSTPSGECTASIIEEALTCQKGTCTGECKLAVTVGGKIKGLILY